MLQRAARPTPIPLPDAEVIERCTIVRALSAVDLLANCPDFMRSRVMCWADEANAAGLDLLAIGWPDKNYCFALAPLTATGAPVMLTPPAILAAYRHVLRDPRATKLFCALGEQKRAAIPFPIDSDALPVCEFQSGDFNYGI